MEILGVKVDNWSRKELLEKIEIFLSENKFHQIATVNQEFILEAQKNQEYKKILNGCDLNVADSIGIKIAFWRHGKRLKYRFPGADLVLEILQLAENRNIPVFLACRKDGLSSWQETRAAILKKHPNLIIDGGDININDFNDFKIQNSCLAGRRAKFIILLCSLGASYQEFFINSLKNDMIGLGLGVGGSFDYMTGKIKRAPAWMRKIGMEWLFRLYQQPNRWKRIFNALVIFPIRVIFSQ